MQNVRLTIAAHAGFPSDLLDNAMPRDEGVLVASGMTDFERALMAAERDHSQALLMFTPSVDDVSGLLEASRQQHPDMARVVAIPARANGAVSQLLRAGAHEIVLLPDEAPNVTAAVHKAMARQATAEEQAETKVDQTAPLVVVLGPKGGVGKTTTSTNIATEMVARGKRVLMVDLDLQFGDVGLVLGILPERTVYDLMVAPGKLDMERLAGYVSVSADGVHVLHAPLRPEQAETITQDRLEAVLAVARQGYDVVVADTPPSFTPPVIAAIDQADCVVMVGSLDLPGLKNMKVGMETVQLMGFPGDRIITVLNRADSKVGLIPPDVRRVLSSAPSVELPSDRLVPRATNAARPLIVAEPKSPPAKALRTLTTLVMESIGMGEED